MHDGEHAMGHLEQLDAGIYIHFLEDCFKGVPVNDVEEVLVSVIGFYELFSYLIFFVGLLEVCT